MKLTRKSSTLLPAISAMALSLAVPSFCKAQATSSAPTPNTLTQENANQQIDQLQEKNLGDPRAEEAYNKLQKTKDLDKKIKLSKEFINKYPTSDRLDTVYEELAQAYYSEHDLKDFYACADQGIAQFPNDPTLKAVAGATMARAYNHDDPDAAKKLETAEKYEKDALALLQTLKTPSNMTEQQFTAYKKQVSATAHSGLGLIYFRQARFEDSVKELQQATQDASTPDPTDFLVLGGDYQNLNQFKEAADAFNRCARIAGPLQTGCKSYAESSLKQVSQAQ
jgi:tetratricopeptide (TPR) repeat protein